MSEPVKLRRVWLRRVLLFLLLATVNMLVGFAVLRGWESRELQRDLAAAYAATDLLDPDWRLADLVAKLPPVAEGDDIGPLIAEAHAIQKGRTMDRDPRYAEVMEGLKPPLPLSLEQKEFLQGEFDKMPGIVEVGRRLKDRPHARLVTKIAPEYFTTLVPHVQHARALIDVMMHDAWLRSDASPDAGLESCMAVLNLGRSMAHEPFLIAFLVRCRAHAALAEGVERCISQGEARLEMLGQLQAQIEREANESEMLTGLRGERAGMMNDFKDPQRVDQFIYQEGASGRPMRTPTFLEEASWFFSHRPRVGLPGYLLYMDRVVEAAQLPLHEQPDAMARIEAGLQNEAIITKLLAPGMTKICKSHLRSQGQLRSLASVLACERYRMQHKAWPASLESLVEAKLLSTVPLDPCDGKPLRYRRTLEGLVVYSVGDNRVDDGGDMPRDLVVRLWDVPCRKGGVP